MAGKAGGQKMIGEDVSARERLLTKRQVAERLAVSTRSVERLAAMGKLTPVRVLGAVRFKLDQVLAIANGGAS